MARAQKKSNQVEAITTAPENIATTQHDMIATAAYFIAEKNGFDTTHDLDNWLAAEQQLTQQTRQNLPLQI